MIGLPKNKVILMLAIFLMYKHLNLLESQLYLIEEYDDIRSISSLKKKDTPRFLFISINSLTNS